MVAARDEHHVAVLHRHRLVEGAVVGIDALDAEAVLRVQAVIVGFLERRLGVPAPKLREALKTGPTDSRTLREIEQMRFTWHKKDLANAFAMAQTVDPPIELPVAATAREAMLSITVDSVAALLRDEQPPQA